MRPLTVRILQRLRLLNHWMVAQLARFGLAVLKRLPADKALNFADRFARRVGPWFGRHRVALNNLRQAYPEKSEEEIQQIASDMWGNMARLAAEYIFIEQLFDFVPFKEPPGRIEVSGIEIFERIAAEKKPHIIFTGHIGNFELLPVAAATFDLKVTAMFRAPNNPFIADYVSETRKAAMGDLLASRAGAALALARVLEAGGNVGVLVDQKFSHGVPTTFFGRKCETSPLVPKLARQFDCDVYPAHCVRLPGNRFRLVLEEKLDLPRDAAGEVDVNRTTQLLNDVVERWVRENPGQWMWFHKRWNMAGPKRKPAARTA